MADTLYGTDTLRTDEEIANSNTIMELFLMDDLMRGSSKQIQEFVVSEAAEILQERKVLNKYSIMRLSKADDFKRRVKLIAYQLAKESNNANWTKLKFHHGKKKEYSKKILKQFGTRAAKIARIAQKKYIKMASKMKATASQKRAENAK